jgi:hypothetical protein
MNWERDFLPLIQKALGLAHVSARWKFTSAPGPHSFLSVATLATLSPTLLQCLSYRRPYSGILSKLEAMDSSLFWCLWALQEVAKSPKDNSSITAIQRMVPWKLPHSLAHSASRVKVHSGFVGETQRESNWRTAGFCFVLFQFFESN